jgi:glycosyltransferase involved in cell wall biosynthesis
MFRSEPFVTTLWNPERVLSAERNKLRGLPYNPHWKAGQNRMATEAPKPSEATLGIITTMSALGGEGGPCLHVATGRVVEGLAARYKKVYLCAPGAKSLSQSSGDYRIQASNVELIPQPYYPTTISAMRHVVGISIAYARVCRRVDALFIRGLVPYVGILYLLAALHGLKPCHWIVGNPVAIVKSYRRAGRWTDAGSVAYAWQDRFTRRIGRWLTGGAFLCNGAELGEAFPSPRTTVTVSSTVTEDEFFVREDTCRGDTIRILYVGYIRPEKGVKYLLEALGLLKTPRPWELVLVGPWTQFQQYREELDGIVGRLGIANRLRWEGYIPFGEATYRYMREADLLVLPTLSEGTPHVLVEARASSLPVVTTHVGGIPTMVTDSKDALLVPPKDPQALAEAIDRVIADDQLRRNLIRNGLESARAQTLERFVETIVRILEEPGSGRAGDITPKKRGGP